MRVFHREHAGRPIRVVWMLEELSEPYELTVMTQDEGSSEEHRVRHPLGRVPVLEDEEGFVFESAAICLHLADLQPEAGLVPALGTHGRALVYQWAVFAPAELEPWLVEAAIYAQSDPERSQSARRRFGAGADAVAAALGDSEYLVEGRFSVADVLIGTALAFSARARLDVTLPENLRDYLDRLAGRPAFQRASERTSLTTA